MKLGIFAKTFEGETPAAVMRAAAGAGYATVQYNMACSGLTSLPDEIPPAVAASVAVAARAEGVEVAAVSATYNMIHPDPAVREAGHRHLEVIAARCRAMGARLVTLCTGTRDAEDQWCHHSDNRSESAWKDLRASMETAVSIAQRHDIDLGIEPERANVVNSAAAARRLIAEMKSPHIRIVLDAANLFETETMDEQRHIVADAIDSLSASISIAHAKDRDPAGNFVAAGRGILDYPHFLTCLARAGFNGPLITHGLSAADAPHVASFLSRALGNTVPGNA